MPFKLINTSAGLHANPDNSLYYLEVRTYSSDIVGSLLNLASDRINPQIGKGTMKQNIYHEITTQPIELYIKNLWLERARQIQAAEEQKKLEQYLDYANTGIEILSLFFPELRIMGVLSKINCVLTVGGLAAGFAKACVVSDKKAFETFFINTVIEKIVSLGFNKIKPVSYLGNLPIMDQYLFHLKLNTAALAVTKPFQKIAETIVNVEKLEWNQCFPNQYPIDYKIQEAHAFRFQHDKKYAADCLAWTTKHESYWNLSKKDPTAFILKERPTDPPPWAEKSWEQIFGLSAFTFAKAQEHLKKKHLDR